MARWLVNLLVFPCLLLAAAGCGESERVVYKRELAAVGRTVDQALAKVPADGARPVGPADIERIAGDLRAAADQLDELDPPADAARSQARLQRGLRGVATTFDDLSKDLRGAQTNEQKAELFVRFANDEHAERAFDDLIGAQESFAEDGYRVFGTQPTKPVAAKSAGGGSQGVGVPPGGGASAAG